VKVAFRGRTYNATDLVKTQPNYLEKKKMSDLPQSRQLRYFYPFASDPASRHIRLQQPAGSELLRGKILCGSDVPVNQNAAA